MNDTVTVERLYPQGSELPELKLRPIDELSQDELVERYAYRRAIALLQTALPALKQAMTRAPLENGELHTLQSVHHHLSVELDAFNNGVILC
jgi:hypothetical protein